MSFWEVADKLIVEANTSYSWVCSQTGVAESTISTQRKYGTEPKVGFAVRFAKLMGTSVEALVGLPGPRVVPKHLEPLVVNLVPYPKIDPSHHF